MTSSSSSLSLFTMTKNYNLFMMIIVMLLIIMNYNMKHVFSFQITTTTTSSSSIPSSIMKTTTTTTKRQRHNIHNNNHHHYLQTTQRYWNTKQFLFLNDQNEETSSSSTTSTSTSTTTSSSPTINQEVLKEAYALKERAEKERLEAEKMRIELTMKKISLLEQELNKLVLPLVDNDNNNNNVVDVEDGDNDDNKNVNVKMIQKSEHLKKQIENLKKQLDTPIGTSDTTQSTATSTNHIQEENNNFVSSSSTTTTTTTQTMEDMNIPPMPKEVFIKRTERFQQFTPEIKALYAKVVNIDLNDNDDDKFDDSMIENIVEKLYVLEQRQKIMKERKEDMEGEEYSDDNNQMITNDVSLLDMTNAQVGYMSLPPPIQEMICETVGLSSNEKNVTFIVEKLIESNKIKPTGEFGGVEFAMGDLDEEESRGKDREFTEKEIKSAIELFENLPLPMKTMLATSVGADSGNSTAVIEKMIEEKKILPSKDGVEFVVFGNDNDDLVENSIEMIEGDNYVRSMLPEATRNKGNMPSEADANAFFSEVLGRKTFNPISKPEPIPGGYIIRGENKMKSYDALVLALEKELEKSSVSGKIQPFVIRDPTIVTDEQLESNTYEEAVVMITGTNLSPSTNRLVKPLVTLLGGLCIASFSVAVCIASDVASNNENIDTVMIEQMASPLLISILLTQVVHEAAHQIVAFKDKFKTGAPTIVPSFQIGLTGCITPLKTPPPNLNSLFDFALSGPLAGMIVSLGLMYTGLEQQVFMDTTTQSQLPTLPVELLKSSSLAGGMVEWLLGDGLLLSPDPSALIRLHPLAIAGFVGLVSNALNLLPIGNTDGGRITLSLFGRSISRVVRSLTIGLIVFYSFFGGETVNLLLFYTIYAQIWQRESEIPCKNEVETVNDTRAVIALVTGVLVALSVIPMM